MYSCLPTSRNTIITQSELQRATCAMAVTPWKVIRQNITEQAGDRNWQLSQAIQLIKSNDIINRRDAKEMRILEDACSNSHNCRPSFGLQSFSFLYSKIVCQVKSHRRAQCAALHPQGRNEGCNSSGLCSCPGCTWGGKVNIPLLCPPLMLKARCLQT